MTDLPTELQCGLDTTHPTESGDRTDKPIDKETSDRIDQLIAEDTHNDWALAPTRIRGE